MPDFVTEEEMESIDFQFIALNGNRHRVKKLGEELWILYWHKHGKNWVTLRPIRHFELDEFEKRKVDPIGDSDA